MTHPVKLRAGYHRQSLKHGVRGQLVFSFCFSEMWIGTRDTGLAKGFFSIEALELAIVRDPNHRPSSQTVNVLRSLYFFANGKLGKNMK